MGTPIFPFLFFNREAFRTSHLSETLATFILDFCIVCFCFMYFYYFLNRLSTLQGQRLCPLTYVSTYHAFIFLSRYGQSISYYMLCSVPVTGLQNKTKPTMSITTAHSPSPKIRSGRKYRYYTDNTHTINFQKVTVLDTIGAYNRMT